MRTSKLGRQLLALLVPGVLLLILYLVHPRYVDLPAEFFWRMSVQKGTFDCTKSVEGSCPLVWHDTAEFVEGDASTKLEVVVKEKELQMNARLRAVVLPGAISSYYARVDYAGKVHEVPVKERLWYEYIAINPLAVRFIADGLGNVNNVYEAGDELITVVLAFVWIGLCIFIGWLLWPRPWHTK